MIGHTNPAPVNNQNLRITRRGLYLFLNRRKDKTCDNCGKKARNLIRGSSRLMIEDLEHNIITYLCRKCN